ncbi:hypothetical protein CS022_22400 [Veronia nyctiphanis]|uniref:Uncharacterized protein n=1 Tax=Veronia nyctiphanis TaxID=1278244 RepID=A0A4Q0YJ99_9GAMM|nr:hypothetical protein [Veronia nyctiphanis]RXJ70780.1 hypothetical protein CS022_22400 [Veronia nyctiphanis]
MLAILKECVFEQENEKELNYIVSSAILGHVYIHYDEDSEKINNFIINNKAIWQSALDTYIKDSTDFIINNKVVVSNIQISNWTNSTPEISINDAIDLIKAPFNIYVENERFDKNFIRLILSDYNRSIFDNMNNKGLLTYTAGGIDELKKVLEENISKLGYRNKRFVFVDSDSCNPTHISDSASSIASNCNDYHICHHILKRRAIENYLPVEYLIDNIPQSERITTNTNYVKYSTFKTLTQIQKNHFHMKKGFDDNSCASSGLYNTSDPSFTSIAQGFGKKFAEKFLLKQHEYNDIRSKMHQHLGDSEIASIEETFMNFVRLPL